MRPRVAGRRRTWLASSGSSPTESTDGGEAGFFMGEGSRFRAMLMAPKDCVRDVVRACPRDCVGVVCVRSREDRSVGVGVPSFFLNSFPKRLRLEVAGAEVVGTGAASWDPNSFNPAEEIERAEEPGVSCGSGVVGRLDVVEFEFALGGGRRKAEFRDG